MLDGPSFIPKTVQKAVILCHGYGSSGSDLFNLLPTVLEARTDTAFFCPNGITDSGFGGYEWFSLQDYSGDKTQTPDYLERLMRRLPDSAESLSAFLDGIRKRYGLKGEDIILGGFSQGGLVSLYTALTYREKLSGAIGMSAVPLTVGEVFPKEAVLHRPPVLLTHGAKDDIVPTTGLRYHKAQLESIGIEPKIILSQQLGHGIDNMCLLAVKDFLKHHLNPR